MKIIIIFLLASYIAFAQTREPEQALIELNGDSVLLNSDLDFFKIDQFMFGWHWGAKKKISKADRKSVV